MIPGMSTIALTWMHLILSLTGILSGVIVLFDLLAAASLAARAERRLTEHRRGA